MRSKKVVDNKIEHSVQVGSDLQSTLTSQMTVAVSKMLRLDRKG